MSLVEQLDRLEEMVTGGSKLLGAKRTMVNGESVRQMLAEVRAGLPDSVKEAEQIINQRDSILDQAKEEAANVREYADNEAKQIRSLAEKQSTKRIESARNAASTMVDDTSIINEAKAESTKILEDANSQAERMLKQAREKSNGIIDAAEQEGAQRRKGADQYAQEVLFGLEERVVQTLEQVRKGIDVLNLRRPAGEMVA